MSKRKAIISYEKLTIEQKKGLLMAYPDGFEGNQTKMTNPITNETFDSLIWETEEVIYLVKLPKFKTKIPSVEEDDDDDDFDADDDKFDGKDEDDDASNDDEDDSYDDKAEDSEEEDDEE